MSEKATTVTVLVADDHPIFREGMVQAIKDRPDLELVGEASGGREALERIAQLRPRVALLDIRMPDLNGTEVLQALRRDGIKTEAVFLSAHLGGELAYVAAISPSGRPGRRSATRLSPSRRAARRSRPRSSPGLPRSCEIAGARPTAPCSPTASARS